MDLNDADARSAWRHRLGELFRDRRVICGIAPLAAYVDWVALLDQAAARRPLLVASGLGAGARPLPEHAEVVFLDVPRSGTMTEDLRAQDGLVRRLPEQVLAAVEAYDPEGEAVWLTGPFIGTAPVLGRTVVGGRPAEWTALEDKLVADSIWDAVGAPRERSAIVPVDREALAKTSSALDAGAGVVWAGDARDGFNGGGDFVRWVATDEDAAAAFGFFLPRCDQVRVMPFLDGIPCSVHGIVLPDGTAAFRPVELAIMRGTGRRFVYGGQGTTWDPPDTDRAQMRDLVRRTGEHLRALVDYRGAFGIDGVLTADGFRPTELNARLSGGLTSMARVVDIGLFNLLQLNLVAGRDPGVTVEELEHWALPTMDATRFTKPMTVSARAVAAEPFEVPVTWDGTALARSWDATGWTVSVGPTGAGTYCRLDTTPTDPPVRTGVLNAALVRFLDLELGTGIGDVTPAPDVRSPS
jgi:hypothetical protein